MKINSHVYRSPRPPIFVCMADSCEAEVLRSSVVTLQRASEKLTTNRPYKWPWNGSSLKVPNSKWKCEIFGNHLICEKWEQITKNFIREISWCRVFLEYFDVSSLRPGMLGLISCFSHTCFYLLARFNFFPLSVECQLHPITAREQLLTRYSSSHEVL